MIPKIIHYTWFSGDSFPIEVQKCIDSWHQHMPDYEYVLWDAERIKDIDSVWLQECLAEKKWAFAADFIRLYAIYRFGGIYLDTDCFVTRNFDRLLSMKAFIGREWSVHQNWYRTHQYLTSHCFGSEAGNSFFHHCLLYYDNRHFITSSDRSLPQELRYDMTLLPFIQYKIAEQLGYDSRPSADKKPTMIDSLTILPSVCFDPYKLSAQTYCTHLCLGSWRSSKRPEITKVTFAYRIKYHLDLWLRDVMDWLGYALTKKD